MTCVNGIVIIYIFPFSHGHNVRTPELVAVHMICTKGHRLLEKKNVAKAPYQKEDGL